ncbi:MAG: isocitrate/isopropylmalate family dehydrogenase, partial [candidate division Zixibacteria bacterium]|nr:isocitrate/isopropylmalate family dehydrogenase [candidate division Zixibacteria bacterium]
MAKYKIAWLPGDGIGVDVMNAAKIVLDKLRLDAEYIHGDIGWEFWRTEGNPFPDRTVALLKQTDCALFGAITSLPKQEAEAALVPELQGKGLVYSSPIVRMRQEFNLRTNLRPCKAYPGNPLNYKEGIDIVVFRENTEDLYSGVEFFPLPDELRAVIKKYNKKMARFDPHPADEIAVSLRINTKTACRNIVTDAFEFAKKTGRKSVAVVEKPNVIRETSGLMVRTAREVAKNYPDIQLWETNIDAMCMWLVKNPT